jgi:hypothetical protein
LCLGVLSWAVILRMVQTGLSEFSSFDEKWITRFQIAFYWSTIPTVYSSLSPRPDRLKKHVIDSIIVE